jgi:hypothetical protein
MNIVVVCPKKNLIIGSFKTPEDAEEYIKEKKISNYADVMHIMKFDYYNHLKNDDTVSAKNLSFEIEILNRMFLNDVDYNLIKFPEAYQPYLVHYVKYYFGEDIEELFLFK